MGPLVQLWETAKGSITYCALSSGLENQCGGEARGQMPAQPRVTARWAPGKDGTEQLAHPGHPSRPGSDLSCLTPPAVCSRELA